MKTKIMLIAFIIAAAWQVKQAAEDKLKRQEEWQHDKMKSSIKKISRKTEEGLFDRDLPVDENSADNDTAVSDTEETVDIDTADAGGVTYDNAD